ncbi:MAG: TolB family protein [Oscillochloridaceae bacterium umkhey_bin13]
MQKLIIAALAALILTACSPATVTPTVTVPAATPTPARNPSPQPLPPEVRLPAPLFLLQGGQIARIEPDTLTRTIITAERVQVPNLEPIATFAASADQLAYIVGDLEADRLVLTDSQGENARIRYSSSGHELSDLRFSPDGRYLFLRLLNNREPPDRPSGLYRLPLTVGPLELLVADDDVDDPLNPSRAISAYSPLAFSPDGNLLLVQVRSQFYEDCTLGVMPTDGGPVVRLALPPGQAVYCGEQAWASDGSAFFFLAGPLDGEQAGPRLWRADPAATTPAPLLADERFARAPHDVPGSPVRFFLATLVRDPLGSVSGATFAPAQLDQATRTVQLLDAASDQYLREALWAPAGDSVVAAFERTEIRPILRWFRLDGTPIDLPTADATIVELAWGL